VGAFVSGRLAVSWLMAVPVTIVAARLDFKKVRLVVIIFE
jgi:hypothetical protein